MPISALYLYDATLQNLKDVPMKNKQEIATETFSSKVLRNIILLDPAHPDEVDIRGGLKLKRCDENLTRNSRSVKVTFQI